MRRIKIHNSGVSHVVGFMLTFTIIALYVISMIFLTSIIIDKKKEEAALLEAKAILNQIVDAVIESSTVKQIYPNADYFRDIEIPTDVVGSSYYIDLGDDFVFLNTTDGKISVKSSAYNLKELNIGVTGKIYSGSGKVRIYCNRTRFIHKFDFGTIDSPVYDETFTKITDSCSIVSPNPEWPSIYNGFLYRVPIYLSNSGENVTDFQVRIQIDPYLIKYEHMNRNGSDIRFYDLETKKDLPYWIEQWIPNGKSFVWVRVPEINNTSARLIYLYYGNQSASSKSNGSDTFLFFDDFSFLNTSKWNFSSSNVIVEEGYLKFYGSVAASVKSFSLPARCDFIARARTTGSDVREASMFCRSTSLTSYYSKGYLFSNGNFTTPGINLAILKNNSIILVNDTNETGIENNKWYKLLFRVYDDIYIGARIPYSENQNDYDYTSIEYVYCSDTTFNSTNAPYFGLCCHASGNYVTYYDWVAVHKVAVGSPILYTIGGEDSFFYWWENVDNTSSFYTTELPNTLYGDFVCNASSNTPATLKVKLVDKFYNSDSLVAYLSFEESITTSRADGNITIDRSGNRNDGRIYGSWIPGFFGTALELNSKQQIGDYLIVSDSDSLDFDDNKDYSIEFWFKPYEVSSDQVIIDKFSNEKNIGFRIYLDSSGYLWFVENKGRLRSTATISANKWYHVVLVNNRSGEKTFYINGVESGTIEFTTDNVTNDAPLFIGKSSSGDYFIGAIDEVRIYRRALSREELRDYYAVASDRRYSISFVSGSRVMPLNNVTISSGGVEVFVNTSPGTFAKNWFLINADSGIIDITIDDKDSFPYYYWNICMLTIEQGVKGIKGVEG